MKVSRSGRPGLSVLTSDEPYVPAVDVKQHCTMLTHWSQFVPNQYVNPTSGEDMKLYIIIEALSVKRLY